MSGRLRPGLALAVLALAALALAALCAACSGRTRTPEHPPPRGDAGVPPAPPGRGDIGAGVDLGSQTPDALFVRYLGDAAFRRAELEASIVNRANKYSEERLEHYATGARGDWDALEEFNPRTAPLHPAELDAAGGAIAAAGLPTGAAPLDIPAGARAGVPAALLELGARAFFRYPAQLVWHFEPGLRSRAAAAQYGFWIDDSRDEVAGLMRAEAGDGRIAFAYSCATCHGWMVNGQLMIGLGNPRLDLGALTSVWMREGGHEPPPQLADWGPGRADVSTPDGFDPVRIPDLRAVRYNHHLHHNGTLVQRSVITLAIRLETLLVTGHGRGIRPPREVALGIALYLLTLTPAPAPRDEAAERGSLLFGARCAFCHTPPAGAGPPVPLDAVGTDEHLGRSIYRGTGTWRVPALLGVGARQTLLHDGSLPSVEALLDPARTQPDYRGGVRPGPVPGHRFGLDLPAPERADLAAYLRSL